MEGRDKKKDISTFGERHLKQITAVCNQDAEITQPLGHHSNQKPIQIGRQNRESEEMTDGERERRSCRDEVKVTQATTGVSSFSEFVGEKKGGPAKLYNVFCRVAPLLNPFPSNGEQMEVRSRDQDLAISLFRSSITCSADCRRSVSAQP